MHCADMQYCAHPAGKIFFGVSILSQIHILTCASFPAPTSVHVHSSIHKPVHIHTQLHTCQVPGNSSTPHALPHKPTHPSARLLTGGLFREELLFFARVFARSVSWSVYCALFLARAHSILEHRSRPCNLECALRGTSRRVRKVHTQRHRESQRPSCLFTVSNSQEV